MTDFEKIAALTNSEIVARALDVFWDKIVDEAYRTQDHEARRELHALRQRVEQAKQDLDKIVNN